MAPGTIGTFDIVMHLGALVDEPPHGSDAVTHNCPVVNVGKVTVTLGVPCPAKIAPATEKLHV